MRKAPNIRVCRYDVTGESHLVEKAFSYHNTIAGMQTGTIKTYQYSGPHGSRYWPRRISRKLIVSSTSRWLEGFEELAWETCHSRSGSE